MWIPLPRFHPRSRYRYNLCNIWDDCYDGFKYLQIQTGQWAIFTLIKALISLEYKNLSCTVYICNMQFALLWKSFMISDLSQEWVWKIVYLQFLFSCLQLHHYILDPHQKTSSVIFRSSPYTPAPKSRQWNLTSMSSKLLSKSYRIKPFKCVCVCVFL